MTRIKLAPVDNLGVAERDAYELGRLNLSLLLAHAPTAYPAHRALTHAIFSQLALPPVERELAVLVVLNLDRAGYPWAQHVPIAIELGISEQKIDAIAEEKYDAVHFNRRECAILTFTRQVVRMVRVDSQTFDDLSSFYSERQMVELIFVIGHYMALGRFSEVFELELDRVNGPKMHKVFVDQKKSRQEDDGADAIAAAPLP